MSAARRRAVLSCALLACALLALAASASAGAGAARRATGPTVTVAVDTTHPGAVVPANFVGLSFEMSSLPQIARYSDRGDFVTMLRSLGPGQLRFGGVSGDTRMAWTDNRTPRPAWASGVIDADDLHALAGLASASGWHVVLTVGIVHYEPQAAAREVAAAKAALGEWLAGIEIGNEPNSYAQHAMREEPWGFAQYAEQVAAYRSAIEAVAPGIPLLGPDVSGSSAFQAWGAGEAVGEQPAQLTGHHYPLGCAQKNPKPSITSLLSPPVRRKEVNSLAIYTRIARAANLPFRMDETNSVSCGGVAGISNTFASALWATGYLAQVMASGAVGVNLHGNVANCKGYSPVCAPGVQELSTGQLTAQPVWYALLMARELVGTRPLPAVVRLRPTTANVVVAAFSAPNGGLRFSIVDDEPLGKGSVTVRLRVPGGYVAGSTLSLTGPSLDALSGTALGEAEVAADGTWHAERYGRVRARSGVIAVSVPAASATLVSVSPVG